MQPWGLPSMDLERECTPYNPRPPHEIESTIRHHCVEHMSTRNFSETMQCGSSVGEREMKKGGPNNGWAHDKYLILCTDLSIPLISWRARKALHLVLKTGLMSLLNAFLFKLCSDRLVIRSFRSSRSIWRIFITFRLYSRISSRLASRCSFSTPLQKKYW